MKIKHFAVLATLLTLAAVAMAACAPQTVEVVVTELVEVDGQIVEVTSIVEVTAVPEAAPMRDTLVICMGQEPDTLYTYGGSMLAATSVLQGVYDGPIENNTYDFQPVILTQLPTLDTGATVINTVTVSEGDTVLDTDDNVVELAAGVFVRPAGCNDASCAVEYAGGDFEMDQMVATFELIEGLTWSDGEPLTADDSVYSFELNGDPDTPAPSRYTIERTTSYEAADDLTTVWTGVPGFIDGTYFVNFWAPLPRHAWSDFAAAELVEAEESSRLPLGWGPYVIDAWETGQFIEMSKNENYWRADEGLPKFETVIWRFVGSNSNANIAALLAGDCDIVDQTSSLENESELLLELQAAGQLNPSFVTGTVWEHADFIQPVADWQGFSSTQAFEDVRLRRAVAQCMDRQAVVDTVLFGQSVVLDTYLPPEHPQFNDSVASYPFDVAAASAALDEIGWLDTDGDPATPRVATGVSFTGLDGTEVTIPDGTELLFKYGTTNATQRQQATQVLQQSMVQCGIGVELEYFPASQWFAAGPEGPLSGRRYDLGQFAWLTGVTPACNLYLSSQITTEENGWSGQNYTGWFNDEFDAACSAALQSLYGTPEYTENHLAAQVIFADQLPVVPLYLRLKLAVTVPEITGFIMDPTNNTEMFNIEEFGWSE
jgi:peptide/nickel transport system substrate-binding protein